METRTKFVAIKYAGDGTCDLVLECKNLTEKEYNKLVNQANVNKDKKILEENDIKKIIKYLVKQSDRHDYILAKALYDMNVERGFVTLDEKFEEDFRNYLYTGDFPQEYPSEYELILNGIRGE